METDNFAKITGVLANLGFIGFIIAHIITRDSEFLIIAIAMKLIAIDTKI